MLSIIQKLSESINNGLSILGKWRITSYLTFFTTTFLMLYYFFKTVAYSTHSFTEEPSDFENHKLIASFLLITFAAILISINWKISKKLKFKSNLIVAISLISAFLLVSHNFKHDVKEKFKEFATAINQNNYIEPRQYILFEKEKDKSTYNSLVLSHYMKKFYWDIPKELNDKLFAAFNNIQTPLATFQIKIYFDDGVITEYELEKLKSYVNDTYEVLKDDNGFKQLHKILNLK